MKVALLQFAPEVGKVKENIQRADEMLQETKLPVDLDWLVLPEMAFSGMYWPMRQETIPFPRRSEDIYP
jgi:protein N-terminal amidase